MQEDIKQKLDTTLVLVPLKVTLVWRLVLGIADACTVMEDPVRLGIRHWGSIDYSQLKDHLREHPAIKLMDVVAERDSALLERNTAIAEKKAACAERDSALLQRDIAYSDRNSALMERDAAVAALDMVRRQGSANEAATKLMHMVNMAVSCPLLESDVQVMSRDGTDLGIGYAGKSSQKQEKHHNSQKENSTKRKASVQSASQVDKGIISPSKKKKQQQSSCESFPNKQEMEVKTASSVIYDCSTIPIPYCSCTGTNQQCYRWGDGGWQSACCTNFISLYPLPMNPKKCGSRLLGRKMSGSAFKKLLEKLAAEGVDITCPLDLKKHWAKHGTNRYVTIK